MYCICILVKLTSYFEMCFVLFGNKSTTSKQGEAGDLRPQRAHYDVIVMSTVGTLRWAL